MCLEAKELILPEEPVLLENPMAHQRKYMGSVQNGHDQE